MKKKRKEINISKRVPICCCLKHAYLSVVQAYANTVWSNQSYTERLDLAFQGLSITGVVQ